ncbi:sterol carrier family protein [Actinomyces sp.]|jgi:hypothetical protein|nr:sterol carrier family protein [uncultured Actinomyces sp.]
MVKRRIDPASGMEALHAWRGSCERGEDAPRAVVLTAVRFTLEELGSLHPGRSVEVRVPPAGAVQILPGTTHRRGTPPAVVETDARTWLSLACGLLTWDEAVAASLVSASGERTDLGPFLPLV